MFSLACLGGLSLLITDILARPGRQLRINDDNDPISQTSRVTAFVNDDEGLRVQCWEIGDFTPNQDERISAKGVADGSVRTTNLSAAVAGNIEITLFSFSPSVTLFSFDAAGEMHASSAVDFRAKPNLFTIKDGLVYIEARPSSGEDGDFHRTASNSQSYVFADINGDDWFYFEDTTSSSAGERQNSKPCPASKKGVESDSVFIARTISGSDTTLVNFQYDSTPKHRVLHEGRCRFAGLRPVDENSAFRKQDLR